MHNAEKRALQLDAEDPLAHLKKRFAIPQGQLAPHKIYLCNNSLGLPPIQAFTQMQEAMQCWAELGVDGWFAKEHPWYGFDERLRKPLAALLGARSDEVIAMNSLTVNLHLLLVSFYQPSATRFKILIDAPSFPSDLYAVKSHIRYHGFDSQSALIILSPRPNEHLLREEDIEEVLKKEGESIALVFLNNVNFLTGQVLDMHKLTSLAKKQGCIVGCDVAHAAGNIVLHLHDWEVDFAVGCSYKYLCSGPGGPGIAFVHSAHHEKALPRFSGWWGNDPATRFEMHAQNEFIPHSGAYSWQVSTPSILNMAPLIASLEIFDEVGIDALRKKSQLQTAFLLELLEEIPDAPFDIVTPKNPMQRGAQISLFFLKNAEQWLDALNAQEVICDFRPPHTIRITASPLYTSFHDIYTFIQRLRNLHIV